MVQKISDANCKGLFRVAGRWHEGSVSSQNGFNGGWRDLALSFKHLEWHMRVTRVQHHSFGLVTTDSG